MPPLPAGRLTRYGSFTDTGMASKGVHGSLTLALSLREVLVERLGADGRLNV